jgi:hypothetical protein
MSDERQQSLGYTMPIVFTLVEQAGMQMGVHTLPGSKANVVFWRSPCLIALHIGEWQIRTVIRLIISWTIFTSDSIG